MGSVFLLGVPAMVLLLLTGRRLLPEYRDVKAGRLDLASVALSLAAILPTIYGFKELARYGWQTLPVAAVVVGLVAGVVSVRRQRALPDPLLDLRLFTSRAFSVTPGSMMAFTMLSGGVMVAVAQYLQLVEELSPLNAGLALVPGMAAAIAGQQLTPVLARWIRPAYLFAGGLAVSVAGLALLTRTAPTSSLAVLVGGFVLISVGGAPLPALGTNLVVGSAPPDRAGLASGVVQTANELGYALGIAFLGSLGTFVDRTLLDGAISRGLPSNVVRAARESIASAVAAAPSLPGDAAAELLAAARIAFSHGLHAMAVVAAVIFTVIAILIAIMLRDIPPIGAGQARQGEGDTARPPAEIGD